jgi:hypothetical protein
MSELGAFFEVLISNSGDLEDVVAKLFYRGKDDDV